MIFIRIATIIFMACLISAELQANEKWCDSSNIAKSDRMPCFAGIISWVEFTHQGDNSDLFKKHKESLESFTRMRVRNDISLLEHEVLDFSDALEKYSFDMTDVNMKKTGRPLMPCLVGWRKFSGSSTR